MAIQLESGADVLETGAQHRDHPRVTSTIVLLAAAVAGFAAYPAVVGPAPEAAVPPPAVTPSTDAAQQPARPLTYGIRTATGRLCEVSYQSGLPTEADCFESHAAMRRWLSWSDPHTSERTGVRGR
jgi:hypothetical protein